MSYNFDPNEIQWFDGMVLSCHQFQQEQIRLKATTGYLLDKINPYSWGVIKMKSSVFQNEMFRLEELECILPDYSVLFFPQYDDKPIEVNIKDAQGFIYCVVPNDYTCAQDTSRYDSVYAQEVVDINTGDNRQKVFRMTQRFTITTEKPPVNSINFPIALTSRTYDAPTPLFSQAINSGKIVETLLGTLYRRILENETKIHRDQSDITYRMLLPEIVPLTSLIQSKNAGCFDVYQNLLRLCGAVIWLDDSEYTMPSFSYDHADIYSSFAKVCDFISTKLSRVDKNHASNLREFKSESGRFSCIIPINQSGYIDIIIQSEQKMNVREWVANAIIASHDAFEETRINRTIGCKREIIDVSEAKCQVRITYNKEHIKSNLLWIENALTQSQPRKIFLV